MPFPFVLPSTSLVSYPAYFSSPTHPLLPLTATNNRTLLRNALKRYRRYATPSDLTALHAAITDYVPYLLALSAGLSNKLTANEEIALVLDREPVLEWRPTLTATPLPGRQPPRLRGQGLDYEIAFVLATLAYTHTLLSRSHLHALYAPTTPTPDQRVAAITAATKHLLNANAVHTYVLQALGDRRSTVSGAGPVDISAPVQSALAALALAEATLLAVLKDDPYPGAVAQERNRNDRDWMIMGTEMPRVRAHLFARLCVGAGEHARRAGAMLGGASSSGLGVGMGVGVGARKERVDEGLVRYVEGVRRVARGRACRFLGIDAEAGGRTGEGIAWLRAGRRELGLVGGAEKDGEKGGLKGLARLKREWVEKREDRRVERGGEWGVDGGRLEEGRVIEMLERKWGKMNDTMNTQLIPSVEAVLATMPSGREIHTPKPYVPPSLDEDVLVRMRAPPDGAYDALFGADGDSSSEEGDGGIRDLPGAFPAGRTAYGSGGESAYY